ncbi:MAG TPA: DUF3300 domain-containing protein, partial [Usitatibacter sp.]|nr:DUF3300 domain-containing protein [Usitatibacter sp.]
MKRRILATAAIVLASVASAWAQQSPPPSSSTPPAAVSQEELDKLLAPIALYPDSLLAQVLMGSTYPLEIVLAGRWSKENKNVTGKALEDAMQKQSWDPSVKGLTAVPTVLERMNENLGWTQKLGDAFLADQAAVMATVQSLRAKAQAQGNLKTTPEQTVKTETQENKTVIVIEPAQPEKIYVPTYDPYYAYGPWWYSYPPYYMYPYGYYYAPGVAFATGILVGAAIWGGCNWGGGGVYINHNSFNNFNRTNVGNGNWGHNVDHRKGVAYGNDKAAQKFNRGGDRQAAQSREQFRARADAGRSQLSTMDRGQPQNRASAGDRAGSGNRASTSNLGSNRASASVGSRDIGSRNGSGFSGSNYGSSSRAA